MNCPYISEENHTLNQQRQNLFCCEFESHQEYERDVAQLGSAAALGAEGCRFKSCHPDFASMMQLVDISC